jgi:hypothetical protein
MLNNVSPEWRNWQTRETQNLVACKGRVGSTPSSGTNHPLPQSSRRRDLSRYPGTNRGKWVLLRIPAIFLTARSIEKA